MTTSTSSVLEPALEEGSPPLPPPTDDVGPPALLRVAMEPPPVSNATLAMLALIVFESMLFAGLLSAYIVLRTASAAWPPAGQPYLPIGIIWLNTIILLGSCVPLVLALRALRAGQKKAGARRLTVAAAMGAAFLSIQGFEWMRLLAHGMTVEGEGGVYGAIFMMLIGAHGLHVLAAVVWLGTVALLTSAGRLGRGRSPAIDICAMYWYFVCAVWIALFGLVYLA